MITVDSTPSRRHTRLWIVLGVLALAIVALAVGLLISYRHSQQKPPPLVAGPGRFRVVAQHGSGRPPPQLLTIGTTRVSVALGATFTDHGRATAGMSFDVPSDPSRPSRDYATYTVGDSLTLGTVHIRVLAIYIEPNEDNDAVDLQITTG